jgi:DNA polymerase-3 subunit epsilon
MDGLGSKPVGFLDLGKVAGAGFFYERYRATNDCLAAVALLGAPLPLSGRYALEQLLERVRQPTWRVWAENLPFDLKDVLKARGYRWNGEGTGAPKAWFIDVADAARADELAFLQADLLVRRIDAYDRFSDRC